MFFDRPCRDLVQGTRTLQIALALEAMTGDERAAFTCLLDDARQNDAAREGVRNLLRDVRFVMPWLDVLNKYRTDALDALTRAAPQEPARTYLHELLASQTSGV
jgi:geranylgeranyl pyrophosphate synthase